MAEVDALSWQEFEAYFAELCQRDGCTKVVVTGKSGDLGARSTTMIVLRALSLFSRPEPPESVRQGQSSR